MNNFIAFIKSFVFIIKYDREFSLIQFSGAFYVRSLFALYLHDSCKYDGSLIITCYCDILFIHFKLLTIEI